MTKNFASKYSIEKDDPWGSNRISQKIRNSFFTNAIKGHFAKEKIELLVDLACGDGILTNLLCSIANKIEIYDGYVEMLHLAQKNIECEIILSSKNLLPNLPFGKEKKIDVLVCIEALHYLPDCEIQDFFSNVIANVSSETILIITLPKGNERLFKDLFYIIGHYIRYKEFALIPDIFYFAEKKIKEYFYKRKFLLQVLHPIFWLFKVLYTSNFVGYFFYNIGRLLKIRHQRDLYILKKKS